VADRLGTCHHALTITEQDYLESYERTVRTVEEPLNHAHSVQLLRLSEFAKQYVTVVLTGEGSDEVFGGYPRFHIPLLADMFSLIPKPFRTYGMKAATMVGGRRVVKLLEGADDTVGSVVENSRFTPRRILDQACPGITGFPERFAAYQESQRRTDTRLGLMLHFDQRSYLPSLLTRLDKTSMAAAIECRVPFLDYRLVEWSRFVPANHKIQTGRRNKVIVKAVASRWLPNEIITRKKVGFGVPIDAWLRNKRGLGKYLDLLTDSVFRQRGYCDPKAIEGFISEHLRKEADHSEILWALINLELWWRMFIDVPAATSGEAAEYINERQSVAF
jgi:asparagine synthase (glutamine-hydrolysing)